MEFCSRVRPVHAKGPEESGPLYSVRELGLSLQLDQDRLEGLIADVLRQVLKRLMREDVPGLGIDVLCLAVWVSEFEATVGEKGAHELAMRMHDGLLARPVAGADDPHAIVLELDLVVLGVCGYGIGNHRTYFRCGHKGCSFPYNSFRRKRTPP